MKGVAIRIRTSPSQSWSCKQKGFSSFWMIFTAASDCQSVWGYAEVDISISTPSALTRFFQKRAINLGSRSETMFSGGPWYRNTCCKNNSAVCLLVVLRVGKNRLGIYRLNRWIRWGSKLVDESLKICYLNGSRKAWIDIWISTSSTVIFLVLNTRWTRFKLPLV